MEIYLIEHGQFCQGQEIVGAFLKPSDANNAFKEIKKKEERREGFVVTEGLSEYDHTPGCFCGFWSGPVRGNRCADGWRVRAIEVK